MRVYLWKHYADREPSYADYHCRTDDKHHHLGSEFGFVSVEREHSIRKWDLCLDTPSTIPPAGAQSESVTFTPSNTTDYTTVTSSTTVEVNGLSFSNPTINTGKGIQIINGGGPALVPFPNGLNAKAVLQLLYVDPDQDVEMAYSTDGLNYTNVGRLTVPYGTGVAELDCTPVYTDHCGVAAAEYNSEVLYVAYNDNSCNCLYVLQGTQVPNIAAFTWTLAYTEPAYQLVSTPAMLVVSTGPTTYNLIIRYGTTEGNDDAYSTVYNSATGTWSTQASNGSSPTQSALFRIDGTNYAIDGNSTGGGYIYITQIDNNGVAVPGTTYALLGGDSASRGLSSTVYNIPAGNCAVVTSIPPGSNELQILSTSDYYNFADGGFWGSQTYSNNQEVPYEGSYPGDFAITTYPSASAGIVVAYSGDNNGELYAASGTPAPCF